MYYQKYTLKIRHNHYVDKEVFFIQKSKTEIFDGKEGVIIIPPSDRRIEARQMMLEYIPCGTIGQISFINTFCKPELMPEYDRKSQNKEIHSLIYARRNVR